MAPTSDINKPPSQLSSMQVSCWKVVKLLHEMKKYVIFKWPDGARALCIFLVNSILAGVMTRICVKKYDASNMEIIINGTDFFLYAQAV
jgi:hypothetical protein